MLSSPAATCSTTVGKTDWSFSYTTLNCEEMEALRKVVGSSLKLTYQFQHEQPLGMEIRYKKDWINNIFYLLLTFNHSWIWENDINDLISHPSNVNPRCVPL